MTMARQASIAESLPKDAPKAFLHRHVLDLDDFSRGEIETVFRTTDAMKEVLSREIKKVPTLRGKTIVTLFYEASTRTRVSFELAAKNLSADTVTLSAAGSSVDKGESLLDTVRTLQALGADVLIMRHPQSGAPYLVAQHLDAHVINAGDGWHAHPTQALLDIYTMREKFGHVQGLKVAILGDIMHSRVARSNLWGLTIMGAEVVLCGPSTLMPTGLRNGQRPENGLFVYPAVRTVEKIEEALEGADVVMALRLQKERQQAGLLPSLREYVRLYQLNAERLALAKPQALVMHPGPMNEGIEITADVAHGPQSVIEGQVANGVAVRMALLYLLAGRGRG